MSQCPECKTGKTQVIDSRYCDNGWTKRRRRCTWGCEHRWNTYEIPEEELNFDEDQRDDVREDDEDVDG